jgi:hypothetical protein
VGKNQSSPHMHVSLLPTTRTSAYLSYQVLSIGIPILLHYKKTGRVTFSINYQVLPDGNLPQYSCFLEVNII